MKCPLFGSPINRHKHCNSNNNGIDDSNSNSGEDVCLKKIKQTIKESFKTIKANETENENNIISISQYKIVFYN